MSNEQWKTIQGYEGLYSVSNRGRVYSYRSKRCLKPAHTKAGYHCVHLADKGKVSVMFIHRLVALAFIPNPQDKPTVNHINEIKTDNRVENLEWATNHEQNINGTRIARVRAHTDYKSRGIDYSVIAAKHDYKNINKKQRKPVLQLSMDGLLLAHFDSLADAARSLGIKPSHICCCLKGRRKSCAGYQWKYV